MNKQLQRFTFFCLIFSFVINAENDDNQTLSSYFSNNIHIFHVPSPDNSYQAPQRTFANNQQSQSFMQPYGLNRDQLQLASRLFQERDYHYGACCGLHAQELNTLLNKDSATFIEHILSPLKQDPYKSLYSISKDAD
jgi:hypothetical protein